MTDLFEQWETLPIEVLETLDRHGEIDDYIKADALLKELNQLGYTFDYDLSSEPYNLIKL